MQHPFKTYWEELLVLDSYTEGPCLDAKGQLFFTTIKGQDIFCYTSERKIQSWARLLSPNGQRILSNGHHLICNTLAHQVVELDAVGNLVKEWVSGSCAQSKVLHPNDLAIDDHHGFYFTDSNRANGKVFFVSWQGQEVLIAESLDYPNGIALSPDHRFLYIAESYTNSILMVELKEPGIPQKSPQTWVKLPQNPRPLDLQNMPQTANLPDGIAIDRQGNLWIAHYGMGAVQVVNQQGEWIQSVETGIPATSNLCFSADEKILYVTGGMGEPGPGRVHKIYIV